MGTENQRCRLCGEPITTGLVATGRSMGCCNGTPIAGTCPEHGPVGPHHVETVDE